MAETGATADPWRVNREKCTMKEATKTKLEELAARAPYSNTQGRELGELIGALLEDAKPEEKAPAASVAAVNDETQASADPA